MPSNIKWGDHFDALLGSYRAGLSIAYFRKPDINGMLAGRITINPLDDTKIVINFDSDTLPDDTVISGPARKSRTTRTGCLVRAEWSVVCRHKAANGWTRSYDTHCAVG